MYFKFQVFSSNYFYIERKKNLQKNSLKPEKTTFKITFSEKKTNLIVLSHAWGDISQKLNYTSFSKA